MRKDLWVVGLLILGLGTKNALTFEVL